MAAFRQPSLACRGGCGSRTRGENARNGRRGPTYRESDDTYLCRKCSRPAPPTCRFCGEPTKLEKPAEWKGLKSLDSATNKFTCLNCQGGARRIERIRCRGCGNDAPEPATETRTRSTYEEATDTYLCAECWREELAVNASNARIVVRCRVPFCREERSLTVGQLKQRPTYDKETATFLCAKHSIQETLQNYLAAEYGLTRRTKPADRLKILQDVAADMRSGSAGKPRRPGRLTEEGRRLRSIAAFINHRAPGFRYCAACSGVKYIYPSWEERGVNLLHGSCYTAWQQSEAYIAAARARGNPRDDVGKERRLRINPLPMPKMGKGNRPKPEDLERHFKWTLRHFLRDESFKEIAASETAQKITLSGVRRAIGAFIRRLPESWSEVYSGNPSGRRLDEILPVSRLKSWADDD